MTTTRTALTPATFSTVTFLEVHLETIASSGAKSQEYLIPAFCRVLADFSFTRDQARRLAQTVHTIRHPSAAAITMDIIEHIAL